MTTELDELLSVARTTGSICLEVDGCNGRMDAEPSAIWVIVSTGNGNALMVEINISADEEEASASIAVFRNSEQVAPDTLVFGEAITHSVRLV